MPRSLGNVIADSLQLSLGYAERLLADVTPDRFARHAAPSGTPVVSNHPAFIYGHLSLYGPRIQSQLGREVAEIPEPFQRLFSKDATCQDDPDGTLYPPMDDVREAFFSGYRGAMDVLRTVDDDTLQQPNPMGGPMAEKFPTLGSMHNFYVGGHLMLHLGQMSAWRRMSGLGPA